jgi:hypothetical protein
MTLNVDTSGACFIIDELRNKQFDELNIRLSSVLDFKSTIITHIFGHEKTAIECFK